MHKFIYANLSLVIGVLFGGLSGSAHGFELLLPPVGTDINYNFHAEMPDFLIAESAATEDILSGRLTFAGEKALKLYSESDEFFFGVYLQLRSPGILDLFDEIFIGFDESLTLLDKDGSVLGLSPTNSSIAYNPDLRDTYEYGWDFRDPGLSTIYGIEWNIVPNLQAGKTLPAALGLEVKVFIPGAVYVVPEPAAVVLGISLVFLMGVRRGVTAVYR